MRNEDIAKAILNGEVNLDKINELVKAEQEKKARMATEMQEKRVAAAEKKLDTAVKEYLLALKPDIDAEFIKVTQEAMKSAAVMSIDDILPRVAGMKSVKAPKKSVEPDIRVTLNGKEATLKDAEDALADFIKKMGW